MGIIDEVRKVLGTFADRVTNNSIRNILINYSEREVGLRHPDLPLGVMVRDQGQFDLYAGPTRLIGTMDGDMLGLARIFAVKASMAVLAAPGPESLVLAGKTPVRAAHAGADFLSFLPMATSEFPTLFVRKLEGDQIVDVPMAALFQPLSVFEDPPYRFDPQQDHVDDFLARIAPTKK